MMPVARRRVPHRARFGHLPRDQRPLGRPLTPSSCPAAFVLLHRDPLAAQAHCLSRRAAPHQTRARPHETASSRSMRRRRARATCTRVLVPRTRTACTRDEPTGPHATGIHLVHLQRAHWFSHCTYTRRAHRVNKAHTHHVHTRAHLARTCFHTPCTHVLTGIAYILSAGALETIPG